jgi:hypothetical protein
VETDPLVAYLARDPATAACLESSPQAGDYRRRRGFYRAAVLMLQAAMREEAWQERDPLIWPALYSFRHYLELTLKMLARDTPVLIPPSTARPGHRLDPLWQPVRAAITTHFGSSADEEAQVIDEAIAVLNALDRAGDALRYSTTPKGHRSISQDLYLDTEPLLSLFVSVERFLSGAETGLDAHQTTLMEIRDAFDMQ